MTSTVRATKDGSELDEIQRIEEALLRFGESGLDDDAAQFVTLYQHYKPSLTSFAAGASAVDPDGVADLALYDGYRALHGMERKDYHGFRGYLFKAAKSHLARERRRALPVIPTEMDDQLVGSYGGFETDITDSMDMSHLIAQLPADQRAVVQHRFFDGLTAEETGRLLGKKPNAIYQLQHRATRRLQRMLLAGLVLLMLAAGAAVLVRQSNTQVVDSSPARPDQVDEQAPAPKRDSPTPTSSIPGRSEQDQTIGGESPPAVVEGSADGGAQISTTKTETQSGSDLVAPSAPAQTTTTVTVVAEGDQQPAPEVVDGSTADQAPPATATTLPATAPGPIAAASAIANDDAVQGTLGQPINLNVLSNDSSPTIDVDTVTVTSGGYDGLTLSADGRLTGTPGRVGYGTIVYRLTASNGSTSIAVVQITVE